LQLYSPQVAVGKIGVFNAAGKRVYSNSVHLQKGYNQVMIDKLEKHPGGIYMVVVEFDGKAIRQKMIITD
jgi:hypothetical protein